MKRLLVAASIGMLSTSGAWAIGTLAETSITNSASLSYEAGGVAQDDVSSNDDVFIVDKKIDMVLEINDANHVPGALGQKNVVTSYSFKNEGNSDQRFNFHIVNLADGEDSDNTDSTANDTADVSDMVISCTYTDQDGNTQTETGGAGDDILIYMDVDTDATCTVSSTLPTSTDASDEEVMNIELSATAYKDDTTVESETTVDDTQGGTADVVFADGESVANDSDVDGLGDDDADDNASRADTKGDGIELARNGYIIQTPVLSVTKSSCVLSDPVNDETKPKRIPGAIIRYMFDIKNTGTGDVSDLTLTDTLANELIVSKTKDSANKTENQGANACVCTTEATTGISDDTTFSGQDMTIEHLNVAAGHAVGTDDADNHTCVSVSVELD